MVFEKAPNLLVAYLTSIVEASPGITGFLEYLGMVHPQLDFIFAIIIGDLPLLVNVNSRLPSVFCSMVP